MLSFIKQLFTDKDGNFSMRELIIALLCVALITSWIGRQFFGKEIPEFMFYSFTSLIAGGCFGYSIEKKSNNNS